jgi:hypothetical protein
MTRKSVVKDHLTEVFFWVAALLVTAHGIRLSIEEPNKESWVYYVGGLTLGFLGRSINSERVDRRLRELIDKYDIEIELPGISVKRSENYQPGDSCPIDDDKE